MIGPAMTFSPSSGTNSKPTAVSHFESGLADAPGLLKFIRNSIAAEYIHRDDYLNGARLVTEAARQVGMRWDTAFSRRIRQVPDAMRARLGG